MRLLIYLMTRLILTLLILLPLPGFSQAAADFIYQATSASFCVPSTIQFKQNCGGQPIAFAWHTDAGDFYEANPVVTFSAAGNHSVTLTAFYDHSSSLSVTKTITIYPAITASVSADRNYLCKPGNINFTAVSSASGITSQWVFGDGSAAVITTNAAIAHYYADSGSYPVTVNVKSANGCIATAQSSVSIKPITVTGSSTRQSGCTPVTITFAAKAVIPLNSTVANYSWNFNDGTAIVNATTNSVSKLFNTDGIVKPVVTVTTSEGCTASYHFPDHSFGSRPANVVPVVNQSTACASTQLTFSNNTVNATRYLWNFGNGASATVTDTFVKYTFNRLGPQQVKLVPINYGCPGRTATLNVNLVGVVAKFNFANGCASKNTFTFTSVSQGNISSLKWNFYNVVPGDSLNNISRTFPASGSYPVRLDVYDSITKCSSGVVLGVYITNPVLRNNDSAICKYSSSTFKIENSINDSRWRYSWNLLGRVYNPDSLLSKTVVADTAGIFKNFAVINYGAGYCPDTVLLDHDIVVGAPLLQIDAPASLCINDSFKAINRSVPFVAGNTISNWQWDFGDKSGSSFAFNPPAYLYKKADTFRVKLAATDVKGCRDSLVHDVIVNPLPFVRILNAIDTVCLGNPDTLIAISSDSITWQPSSLFTCNYCDTAIIKPSSSVRIYVGSIKNNCTATDSMDVKLYKPFNASANSNTLYLCPGQTAQLNAGPGGKKIVWSPAAAISNLNVYDPVIKPSSTTVYTATVTDSVNCFSSTVQVDAVVKTPPVVDAGPSLDLLYNTAFTFSPVYSNNIVSYLWKPGNDINCSTCAVPNGKAIETTMYTVTVTSDSGCVATDSVRIGVQCSDASLFMATAFTPNGDNLNDLYRPLVKGVRTIRRFTVFNRYGQAVYEARDFSPADKSIGWNGRFNGQDQPNDTYQYLVDMVCELGELVMKKGSFVLIR